MKLKSTVLACLFIILFSNATFAQPATKADIEVLGARIDSLDTKIGEMDKRLTTKIDELDKRLTSQIGAIQVQINMLFWAIGALIAIVLAVIAVPQFLGFFQERRARADYEKRFEEMQRRLDQQQEEIDELKSRKIVTPS